MIGEELKQVLVRHKTEINEDKFIPLIADVYLTCGAKGLEQLKELLYSVGLDKKAYNKAIEKMIKDLLRNSDLLDET